MSATEVLKLFGPTGEEIPASRKDLLRIEGQSFKKGLYRRTLGDNQGTYWLVSARPGQVRMVLEVHWSKHPNRDEWSVGFCTNGIASYSHWDIDSTIRTFTEQRRPIGSTGIGYTVIPANVEALAREHVYFMEGAEGENSGPRPRFSIKTLDADAMTSNLAAIAPDVAADKLLELAGKPVEIMELTLAAEFFCGDNNLDGRQADVTRAMVPFRSRLRLRRLLGRLGAALAAG